jgi:hypothetical protein
MRQNEAQVVAAARHGGHASAPVMARPQDHPYAGRAMQRPDAPDQLRRTKRAPVIGKARREIGDLDALSARIEQPGAQYRGARIVVLFTALNIEQFHREAAIARQFVARIEQGMEHRVGIEAWQATPHQARTAVDQGADGAIADQRKVERRTPM